ncbi:phage major capsid protein, partial [Lacticaseibacillus paracasei]
MVAALICLALFHLGVFDATTMSYVALAGATLGLKGKVTLHDVAKSLDPEGKTATVVELLNQTNEIITDMNWHEGNLPTGHE